MKLLVRLLLVVILLVLCVTPAIASVNNMPVPTGAMSIIKVYAYQNSLVVGDQLFIAQINIPYTTAPTTPSSAAFLGRLIDGAGVEVASTPVTTYYNNGYSYNTIAIYLDPTSVIPWNDLTHTMVVSGSPTLNWLGNSAATAMSGAVNNAAGNETAAANSAAANDMTLSTAALDSAYYFGSVYAFNKITINIGTSGVGTYTTIWEYWNGTGWHPLPGVFDGTDYFKGPVGSHDVTFTIPTNWAATIVAPVATSQMWIRARVDTYTSMATPPLGTQSWVNGNDAYPDIAMTSNSFIWNTSASIATTQNLIYTQTIAWAATLSTYWSYLLTTLIGSTMVLSTTGQTYFLQVMSALQQMCPRLFSTTVTIPKYTDKAVNVSGADAVTSSWPLDWSGIAHYLGFTGTDMVFRTVIAFAGIFFMTTIVASKSVGAAIPVAFFLLVAFGVVGWVSPVLIAGIVFIIVIAFGLVFILGKPTT